jgi:hypothetical protein
MSPAPKAISASQNASAFGDVGDDYVVTGAHGDKLLLGPLPVPVQCDPLPQAGLPSAVMGLAQNYAAFARDLANGTKTDAGLPRRGAHAQADRRCDGAFGDRTSSDVCLNNATLILQLQRHAWSRRNGRNGEQLSLWIEEA